MTDERRSSPRIQCDARVDYGSPNEVILDHEVQNLSLGGACLAVSEVQPIGTKVVLFLTLPGTDAEGVEVEGEVAWCNDIEPRDIGIRFITMDERARQLLVRYVEGQIDEGAPVVD